MITRLFTATSSCRGMLICLHQARYLPTNCFKSKLIKCADVNFSIRSFSSKAKPTVKLKKSEVSRLFQYAKPEAKTLACAVTLLTVSSLVTVAFPFFMGRVIDIIYSHQERQEMKRRLSYVCKILGGVILLGGITNFGRVYLIHLASQRITNNIRRQAHSAIISQEIAFFDNRKTGDLLNRLSADTALVGNSLTQNISDGLRSAIGVIGGTSMMVYTSPELSMVGLAIVPPVAVFAVLYGRRMKKTAAEVQLSLADANASSEEQISNIRTVRSFAKEDYECQRYSIQLDNVYSYCQKEAMQRAIFFGSTGATGNIIILAVLYYGGTLAVTGQVTVGGLSSFLIYAAYVGISLGGLSGFFTELMKSIGASSKIWEIIDRKPTIPLSGGLSPSKLNGKISFEHVTFAYNVENPILRNFSMAIEPGTTVAIVGPSGSGKSTVAHLLLRLYDAQGGALKIDDINIKDLDPFFLRRHVGIVSQEPVLFSSSIRENILYGALDPDRVTDQELHAAAGRANVLEFIDTLPDGWNTLVGERGIKLSGGQRQRVAIARAILRNPRILILDEATSSLDSISEHLVQTAIQQLAQGRTMVVIAHRLSTIRDADRIVVLKDGSVCEQGTYQQLVSFEEGVFKNLVSRQVYR